MAKSKKTEEDKKDIPINGDTAEKECENATDGNATETTEDSKKIEELQKKLDETNDRLLRTVAEYDNFRKRSQKEKDAIYGDSKSDVISKLLPVIDNFERAASSTADFESYKKGVDMTVKQLIDTLTSLGVETFGEVGEEFDANLHYGVMHVEDEELGENVIADVLLKGYKTGDKIIRHATVKVAN